MRWCEANRVDYLFGLGEKRPFTADSGQGTARGEAAIRGDGPSVAGVQGLHLSDAKELESRPSRGGQGRALGQGEQSAIRGDVAFRRRNSTPARCTRTCTAPEAKWRTGSRSSNCVCSPTARVVRRCVPTNCGCGCRAWPTRCWGVATVRTARHAAGDRAGDTIRLKLLKIGAVVRDDGSSSVDCLVGSLSVARVVRPGI